MDTSTQNITLKLVYKPYTNNLDLCIIGFLQNQSSYLLSRPTSHLSEGMENSTFCRSYTVKNEPLNKIIHLYIHQCLLSC